MRKQKNKNKNIYKDYLLLFFFNIKGEIWLMAIYDSI